MQQASWTRSRERGSVFWIRFIVAAARALPRSVVSLLLYPITLYFFIATPAQRKASRAFLTRALGHPPRLSEIYAHYLTFARALLDRVYWLGAESRAPESAVESGTESLDSALREGRGLLIVGAHLGSFEALRAIGLREGRFRVRPLMYLENSHKTQQWLSAVNPQLADDIIVAGRPQTMLEVRAALGRGEMVGVLADRSIIDDRAISVRFLGEPAKFPTGAYRLALLLDVPIFFGCSILEGNRYRIFFETIDARRPGDSPIERDAWIRDRVEAFAGQLERYAMAHPLNWFNFYDFWQVDGVSSIPE